MNVACFVCNLVSGEASNQASHQYLLSGIQYIQ